MNALAFFGGLFIGRRGRSVAITAYVVVLTLLLFKAVINHHPHWEFALFPWTDYIYFQSFLVFPIGLACLGLAVGMLPSGRNRRAVAGLAVFCFTIAMWTERWILVPPDDSSDERATANHHCIQTTDYSCGPATCVSLLSYWGVDTTEGEMMRLCRTPPYGGTSLFRICRGIQLKLDHPSFTVRIVDGDPYALRALGVPAIVSVRRIHVVTVKFEGEEVWVHDPASAEPHRLTFAEYRQRYGGPAVVVERLRLKAG